MERSTWRLERSRCGWWGEPFVNHSGVRQRAESRERPSPEPEVRSSIRAGLGIIPRRIQRAHVAGPPRVCVPPSRNANRFVYSPRSAQPRAGRTAGRRDGVARNAPKHTARRARPEHAERERRRCGNLNGRNNETYPGAPPPDSILWRTFAVLASRRLTFIPDSPYLVPDRDAAERPPSPVPTLFPPPYCTLYTCAYNTLLPYIIILLDDTPRSPRNRSSPTRCHGLGL